MISLKGVVRLIETVYSNENGDDRTSKAGSAFKMPKNIRQVGKSGTARKIYVEDYVMSFIKQLAGGELSGCVMAVLVGQCIRLDSCLNIFISGAVKVDEADIVKDIVFTNDTWTSIYEEIKKYFVETEIVGWYIGGPGYLLTEEGKIQKIHIDNFAGQDKVLLTFDNQEKEEAFFCYENNCLSKQEGYYIYYEKNDEMQSYIIDHKQAQSCEADYNDKVSKDIRTVIMNKKPPEEDSKSVTRLMYAAGTLLAIILLIVGATMLNNFEQMKSMQETLNHLSKNIENVTQGNNQSDDTDIVVVTQPAVTKKASSNKEKSKNTSKNTAGDDSLDIEVKAGDVAPLEKDTATTGKDSKDNDSSTSDKELAGDSTKSDTSKSNTGTAKKESKKKTAKKELKPKTNKKEVKTKTVKTNYSYYTVKDGDTLADISYKLYSSYSKVKKIMEINGIEDQDLIYSGQKLKVP